MKRHRKVKTKLVVISQPEIQVTEKEYIEMRDKTIDDIMNNSKKAYKNKTMISGIRRLCDYLQTSDFNVTSTKLVRGLTGFIRWSEQNNMKTDWALTNIIHDLGEFSRNAQEEWFSPRTTHYSKYL